MSQAETEQVVKVWFDALDRADYATAMGCLAEDVYWVNLPKIPGVSDIIPWLGTCHGVAEVANSFAVRDTVCEVKAFKPVETVVQGDLAYGTVRDYSTIKPTGIDFDIEFATRIRVTGGKIVEWKSYCDPSAIIFALRGDLRGRLLEAVADDDVDKVDYLLEHGADPDARDPVTGLTALMTAACHANAGIVKRLLDAGADVFTTDPHTGATALHKACQGGSADVAALLVDSGAFVDAVTPTMGHTPIMDALWYKFPEVVRFLVDKGANLNLGTHYGFTLWEHLAFELNANALGKDKLQEIERVLRSRETADNEAVERQTIMAALRNGDPGGATKAIAAGADVNAVYPRVNSFYDGNTPLLVAARDGRTEIVRELLRAGADVNVVDWQFKGAPVHKATYNGNPEILGMLAAHPGIDLDVQGQINGYTPIHDALWHGYTECAEMLVETGVRLDLRGHDGKRPVDVAADVYGDDATLVDRLRKATDSSAQTAAGAGA